MARDAVKALFNERPACEENCSRPRLPGAVHAIFEAGELLGADWAAGMEFPGGDADLGAEAKLAAIGELRRGVVQHERGIDLVEEFFGRLGILAHYCIGMM